MEKGQTQTTLFSYGVKRQAPDDHQQQQQQGSAQANKKRRTKGESAVVTFGGFRVPGSCDTRIMKLEKDNPLPRDGHVVMDPVSHTYYIQGQRVGGSATAFVKSFNSRHFDPYDAAYKMVNGKRWQRLVENPKEPYGALVRFDDPKCRGTILALVEYWRQKGREASELGTFGHEQIELRLNGEEHSETAPGWRHYLAFERGWAAERGLKPFRTELRVYTKGVVGTVDMLYRDADGDFVLVDWKFTRDLLKKHKRESRAPWRSYLRRPFDQLVQTKLHAYFLQLNLYTVIIEKQGYLPKGKRIKSAHLAIFHTDQDDYEVVDVPCLRKEVQVALRKHSRALSCPAYRLARSEKWTLLLRLDDLKSCVALPVGSETPLFMRRNRSRRSRRSRTSKRIALKRIRVKLEKKGDEEEEEKEEDNKGQGSEWKPLSSPSPSSSDHDDGDDTWSSSDDDCAGAKSARSQLREEKQKQRQKDGVGCFSSDSEDFDDETKSTPTRSSSSSSSFSSARDVCPQEEEAMKELELAREFEAKASVAEECRRRTSSCDHASSLARWKRDPGVPAASPVRRWVAQNQTVDWLRKRSPVAQHPGTRPFAFLCDECGLHALFSRPLSE